MYIDSSVTGKISMRLDNVSLNDALIFIMKEYNLSWERTGDIVKIYRPEIIPPPPAPLDIEYSTGKIAFDLRNAELTRFIEAVADISGKNIIIDAGADGTITGQLAGIEFEKGMEAVLNSNGFTFSRIDEIYHVGFLEKTDGVGRTASRYAVFCQGDSVTIDVRNAPIADILGTLSDKCQMGIIVHGKIEGTITASYKNKPFSDVLGFILRETQYSFKKDGDIYFVGNKGSEDLFSSKLIRLEHVSGLSVQELVPAVLAKQVSVKLVQEQNGLIVTGPSTAIMEVESFLNKIDIPPAQVLFEAIVVDYNLSELSEFSLTADNTGQKRILPDHKYYPKIDYSNTGDNLNDDLDNIADFLNITNIGHLSNDFFMQIRMMEEEGVANIRSRPQIAALNGHPASIKIGTSQYFLLESQTVYPSQQSSLSTQTTQRFEVIEADMSLEVTPWVTESGEIIVEIQPEFNSPATAFDSKIPPTINRRILKSTVRLRDGETIILGGMIQNLENISIKKFPILGDLPIIGRIFQNRNTSKTKSELMVYLTPHIYYGNEGSVEIQKIIKAKE
jgi:type IV pilus assembly protein PilQ